MTWNTIRFIIAIAFAIFVIVLMIYVRYLEHKLHSLQNKISRASKEHSNEHLISLILCKILTDTGMTEEEIEAKVNAELSKIEKERR